MYIVFTREWEWEDSEAAKDMNYIIDNGVWARKYKPDVGSQDDKMKAVAGLGLTLLTIQYQELYI